MKATIDPLTLYGVSIITGNEDLPTIKHAEDSAMKYLLEMAKKDEQGEGTLFTNVPAGKWKQYLKSWVLKDSEPFDILFRPLINSPSMFFKALSDRADVVSKKYSSALRDLTVKLTKYQTMDAHNRELYEYSDEFYADRLESTVKAAISTAITLPANVFADASFNKGPGLLAKNTILALVDQAAVTADKVIHDAFCEKFVCEGIMAIMSSDPTLYDHFEVDAKPLEMSSNKLTDMVQERILRPKHAKIAMKLDGGNTLQAQPQQRPIAQQQLYAQQPFVALGGQVAAPNGAASQLSRKQKRELKYGPSGNGTAQPQGGNGQYSAKRTKSADGTAKPASQGPKLGKRLCNFCHANWPNSTEKTWHDDPYCKRNPASPKFNAAHAKTPVN
jgi:hypothetical protein